MKIRLLFFALFYFFVSPAFGQFALIKMGLGDCTKCKYFLEKLLNESPLSVPTYVVFPKYSSEKRSIVYSQIDTQKLKVPILFNDRLYERVSDGVPSGLFYFSSGGNMVFNVRIDKISDKTLVQLDSIYQLDYKFKKESNMMYKLSSTGIFFKYDTQFGDVDLIENSREGRIKPLIRINDKLKNELIDSLKVIDPDFYTLSQLHQELHPSSISLYRLKPAYFDVCNQYSYYAFQIPILTYSNKDTTGILAKIREESDELALVNKIVLCKFLDDKLERVMTIKNSRFEPGNAILAPVFRVISDSLFLFLYGNKLSKSDFSKKMNYIGQFRNKSGKLYLDEHFNLDFPENYKRNGIDRGEFFFLAYDYPFFVPIYSNTIYNLKEQKVSTIDSLFGLDINLILKQSSEGQFSEYGKGRVLANKILTFDRKNNQLYLVSKFKDHNYCSVLNADNFSKLNDVDINATNIPLTKSKYPLILIDSIREIIYIEDGEKKIRSYPLTLLFAI